MNVTIYNRFGDIVGLTPLSVALEIYTFGMPSTMVESMERSVRVHGRALGYDQEGNTFRLVRYDG